VDRAAIFLKAADLLASPRWRYRVLAATILGQGKNVWQAEIDAAAELIDFWRFNCAYAAEIYSQQPTEHAPGTWNRVEYRPLEGFIYAISPFNFTAIGGNLPSAPALMGNVVLWKPSASAILSNYLIYEILEEAGLPPGVIQFIPGPAAEISNQILAHRDLGGVHFTGSTTVFKGIWRSIGQNMDTYRSYPRLVGETGGKNFHFIHPSANFDNALHNTIRGAFEYQGQKCSACSRVYVPQGMWPTFKEKLVAEVNKMTQGGSNDFSAFCGPVINRAAFDKISGYIEEARTSDRASIIAGGRCDDSKGFFISPTVIHATDSQYPSMREEIFGPVLTVFVYPEQEYEKYVRIDK
jgi:1-pyrroline-5-carboxylate dehydrogenase